MRPRRLALMLALLALGTAVVVAVASTPPRGPRRDPLVSDAYPPRHPAVDRLAAVVPPPARPISAGSHAEWERAEADLGVRFPDDYKALVATYGSGRFVKAIELESPFVRKPSGRTELAEWLDVYRQFHQESRVRHAAIYRHGVTDDPFGEEITEALPIWPEPGGVFRIGSTYEGDPIAWRTRGEPGQWTLLVGTFKDSRYIEFPMGVADWLHLLATKPETAGRYNGRIGDQASFERSVIIDGVEDFEK